MTAPGGDDVGWRWAALAVPVAGIAAVLALLLVALGVFGIDRRGPDAVTADGPAPAADREPVAIDGPAAAVDAVVVLDADHHDLRPTPVLAGFGAGDLVDVRGRGFAGDAAGVIAQCDAVEGRRCRNLFPVRTDGDGTLRAQYRLSATTTHGALVAEVDLERGGALVGTTTRPLVRVNGATVTISGADAGTDVAMLLCGEYADEVTDCRDGGSLTVASDGTARGEVGGRRGERVVVVDASGAVLAEPLALDTGVDPAAAALEVDLDGRRVATGLLIALLLVGAAAQLIRSTDWRGPAEAEVPTFPGAS